MIKQVLYSASTCTIVKEKSFVNSFFVISELIFVYNDEQIWVVCGEVKSGINSNEKDWYSKVDVFTKQGKLINSFKTNLISLSSKIIDGRLYSSYQSDDDKDLHVYSISFNKL